MAGSGSVPARRGYGNDAETVFPCWPATAHGGGVMIADEEELPMRRAVREYALIVAAALLSQMLSAGLVLLHAGIIDI